MFSIEDLKVEDPIELVEHLPILIVIALLLPFIIGAYTLSYVMDAVGWLET